MHQQLRLPFTRSLLAAMMLWAAVLTPPLYAQDVEERRPPKPSIVIVPDAVDRFDPAEEEQAEAAVALDPATINVRKVYEALGEDATLWHQHVQTLSNPFFEGRAPGTRGVELAVEYVQFWFTHYGLQPAFPGETDALGSESVKAWSAFTQPFDFASPNPDVKVLEAGNSINGQELAEGKDYVVVGVSGSGKVTGPVTFVGYGIEEGEEGYSSFDADTDLTGRIALMLRYEPLNEEGKSRWAANRFSRHSGIANKLRSVADRKAAAIIMVNPPGAVDGKTTLENLNESRRFGRQLGVPVVQVTEEVAGRMLVAGDPQMRDLLAWRRLADDGQIKCVPLHESLQVAVTAKLNVSDRLETCNVGGVLHGKGNLADQWIVIGAHLDHVGYGYTGTMPQFVGQLHPGADDNASGTAGMLLLAKRLTEQYKNSTAENLRSILFLGFGAEEAGLIGSKHFVQNAPIAGDSVSLMINMDMIGRMRNNNLSISGTGTAEGFADLLQPHFEASGLNITASPGGRGPSDHSSFYNAGIPVMFTFTGTHAEYHRPADKGYTVNPQGAIKVVDFVESVAMDVVSRADKLKYVLTNQAGPMRRTGARVRLGVQPAYNAELESGVEVEAVSDDTSAAAAGIRAGDVLLTWNGEEITGGQKLFELLGKHDPGDRIKLTVQRAEEVLTVEVVLKGRESN